jgi:hypothetical protein
MFSALADSSAWAESRERKTSLFRLEYLYSRQDRQPAALHDFISSQIPLIERYTHKLGIFAAITGPRVPATVILSGFTSYEDMETTDACIRRDADYRRNLEKVEAAGQSYDRTRMLLRPAKFSNEIEAQSNLKARLFELRTYHSASEEQLRNLHERLANPESGIFGRAQIRPVLQADTLIGPNLPNLTYLIPFEDLAHRDQSWDAATRDSEWMRAHEASEPAHQVFTEVSLLRPVSFSPIR